MLIVMPDGKVGHTRHEYPYVDNVLPHKTKLTALQRNKSLLVIGVGN